MQPIGPYRWKPRRPRDSGGSLWQALLFLAARHVGIFAGGQIWDDYYAIRTLKIHLGMHVKDPIGS